MKKILIFATLLATNHLRAEYLVPTTVEVASAIKFPQTIYGLRDKVHDFLDLKKVEMMIDVQDLRSHSLMYRADKQEELSTNDYEYMRDRFDREFEYIDRLFLAGAERLDREEASVKTKAQFVNRIRTEAIASIKALITHFSIPIKKVARTLDMKS